MARVIDLGNGYGRLEGYPSRYATLTFPLTLSGVKGLYRRGVLSSVELQQALLDMKYSPGDAALLVSIEEAVIEHWEVVNADARTI